MSLLRQLGKMMLAGAIFGGGFASAMTASPQGHAYAATSEYELGPQDRLRIHVSEWPSLTGEMTVGANGDILMPMLGAIRAAGLSAPDLAGEIATRLKEKAKLLDMPDATVDIIAYRPFYILGSVTSPGEYAYRPGMIVLNALSLAGGVYRAERGSQWDLERSAIISRGDLQLNAARHWRLVAEQQRWKAQLDGTDRLEAPAGETSEELKAALTSEEKIFGADLESYQTAKRELDSTLAIKEQEIGALDKQLEDVQAKRASLQAELETIRGLAKQNLAVHRLGPLERSLNDVQRELQDLEIAKLRARQDVNSTQQELASLEAQRRAAALSGLQRVETELRAVAEAQVTSVRILDSAAYYSSNMARLAEEETTPQLRYVIVRSDNGGKVELKATDLTEVKPGDIIQVYRVSTEVTNALPAGTPARP